MKNQFLYISLTFSLLLFSCKEEAKADYVEEDSNAISAGLYEPNAIETAKAKAAQSLLPATAISNHQNRNTGVAVNPPHGQPGHRCDLPVGAALAENTRSNSKNQSPETNGDSNSNNPVNSTKLNPPHGEIGHRCDIAVGAPLEG